MADLRGLRETRVRDGSPLLELPRDRSGIKTIPPR